MGKHHKRYGIPYRTGRAKRKYGVVGTEFRSPFERLARLNAVELAQKYLVPARAVQQSRIKTFYANKPKSRTTHPVAQVYSLFSLVKMLFLSLLHSQMLPWTPAAGLR